MASKGGIQAGATLGRESAQATVPRLNRARFWQKSPSQRGEAAVMARGVLISAAARESSRIRVRAVESSRRCASETTDSCENADAGGSVPRHPPGKAAWRDIRPKGEALY